MKYGTYHSLYIISFIIMILLFNIALTFGTWYCFNLFSVISIDDAFLFVVIFRVIEWSKHTIIDMCITCNKEH